LYSSDDPVWYLHSLNDDKEIEIAGFILACFAYGRVDIMNNFTDSLFKRIRGSIYEFTVNFGKRDKQYFNHLQYRFNNGNDISYLFRQIQKAYLDYGSLKELFLTDYSSEDKNILKPLNYFTCFLKKNVPEDSGFHYLVPDSSKNSACKRLNLFLRWMVRKDEIDMGIWGGEVDKSKLIIPVDIHVYRISKQLNLVNRNSCDMKYAIELTNKLKEFDPEDPVKYDFALCHIGIENKKPPTIF